VLIVSIGVISLSCNIRH